MKVRANLPILVHIFDRKSRSVCWSQTLIASDSVSSVTIKKLGKPMVTSVLKSVQILKVV